MDFIGQLAFSAITLGCIYALVAVGFQVAFNSAGILNFAHGELVVLGAYFVASLVRSLGIPPVIALCLAAAGSALVAVLLARGVIEPLRRVPSEVVLLSTMAVGIALRNLMLRVWGPSPISLTPVAKGSAMNLGGVIVTPTALVIIATTVIIIGILQWVLIGTTWGKIFRAASENVRTAELMGINVGGVTTVGFIVSGLVAGSAGALIGQVFPVTPELGVLLLVKGFVAAVVGGMTSFPGAALGGLVLGTAETFGAVFVSTAYRDTFAFMVLIVVLLSVRGGLLGSSAEDRV